MLPAFLLMLPIVVVDVTGDRLDPAHTRKLVEHELGVTAIAPDDPRAGDATGHIEIAADGKDKKLTVKYRKVDEPIERTIDLADDAARGETDAAFLAGNLARDEASELATEKRKPSIAEVLSSEDDRELAQLRAFVKQTSSDEKSSHVRTAVVEFSAGAAFAATAAVLAFSDARGTEARTAMSTAGFVGGYLIGQGFTGLFLHANPLEPIETKMKELDGTGGSAGERLEEIDKFWAEKAGEARRGRVIVGSASVGIGAILAGIGTAIVIAHAGEENPPSSGLTLIGGGAFAIVTGFGALVGESPLERSHRMWKTVRSRPEPTGSNISFGVSVLPGGGGAASFALTF